MQTSLENSFNRWRVGASRNWVFFRQWLRAPLTTASVVPSSPRLGRAMALALPADAHRVVELGAGTGAITRELLRVSVSTTKPRAVVIGASAGRAASIRSMSAAHSAGERTPSTVK